VIAGMLLGEGRIGAAGMVSQKCSTRDYNVVQARPRWASFVVMATTSLIVAAETMTIAHFPVKLDEDNDRVDQALC
jgi:hypothetical protein